MKTKIIQAACLTCLAGAAFAQTEFGPQEPRGFYGGVSFEYFGEGATDTSVNDASISSFYIGRDSGFSHLEAHVDYAIFDERLGDDNAGRVQVSYGPEFFDRTEIAFYIARSFFDDLATDVTEYGFASNTLFGSDIELYLSAGLFDADGTHDLGASAALEFNTLENIETEFAVSHYDGFTVGQSTVSYFFSGTGIGLSAAALVDDVGDSAFTFGLTYRFGVDKQKFRQTITPLEMATMF